MKKILLVLLVSLFIPTLAYATDYTAIAAGGNWSEDATWGGGGHPVAGDTAIIDATMTGTVTIDAASACAVLNLSTYISNADIDDEDMVDITDWADSDSGAGAESSQATFDGKSCMKLDSGDGGSGYNATRTQDIGTFGARTVFSISVYCDAIGTTAASDDFRFVAANGSSMLFVKFATDGLFIFDGAVHNEVGVNLVVQDVWQEWTFDVNWTAQTVDVYLNKVLQSSGVDCFFPSAVVNGSVFFRQYGGTANRITYVDWFKAGTNFTANGGTLAFGDFVLTCTGNVTLGGSITAGTGGLTIAGTSTLTSGGVTFPGNLVFSGSNTKTLVGNWINTGLVTNATANCTFNKTTTETLTCNGGLTVAGYMNGTASIIIGGTGGILSSSGVGFINNLTFNCVSATVSGVFSYRAGTMTYTAGTITTTGSTLKLTGSGSCVLDTDGIVWNNISIASNSVTYTLASDLTCSDTLSFLDGVGVTFLGAYNIACGTFRVDKMLTPTNIIFAAGQTLTITDAISLVASPNYLITFTSSVASTSTYLNYTGTAANCKICGIIFTDVDASGSAQVIDNWYGGTLTRTTNIVNRTSADIGGTTTDVFGWIG